MKKPRHGVRSVKVWKVDAESMGEERVRVTNVALTITTILIILREVTVIKTRHRPKNLSISYVCYPCVVLIGAVCSSVKLTATKYHQVPDQLNEMSY